jgi:hypothetical protein
MSIAATVSGQQLTSTLFIVYQEIELLLTKFKGGERDENGRRWIWKSNRELFATLKEKFPHLKISLSTVQRSLRLLCEMGYLLRSQRKIQRLWRVQFYALPDWHPAAAASQELEDARESSRSKQRSNDTQVETHKQSSTPSRSTNIRKAVGFGQYKRQKALTEVNAEATRPVDKPAGRIQINGIWVVDDDLFPSYA